MKPFRGLTLLCQQAAHQCLTAVGTTLAGAAGGAIVGALFGTLFALPFSLLYGNAASIRGYQAYFAGCGAAALALTAAFTWWIDGLESPATARPSSRGIFEAKPRRRLTCPIPPALARRMTTVQLER